MAAASAEPRRPPTPWSPLTRASACGPQFSTLIAKARASKVEIRALLVTTNLPFDEWTEVFGSERLTGALLDRLTHHVHILEMNGESYRLRGSRQSVAVVSASDRPSAG